ncbi:MAG: hypothetical protein GX992_04615, partial [Clostridium sp.]|nr:hypothetical protein [Clostridium sp.]
MWDGGEYISGIIYDSPIPINTPLNKFYGVCNLGSLFLHNYINNPFTKNAEIDFDKLKTTIKVAIKFLD